MKSPDPLLAHTRDTRLAAHAFAATPAWLWSADGSRVLWANATAAALLGEPSAPRLLDRRFQDHPVAQAIARIGGGLPADGKAQLARLRGLALRPGLALTCACSRLRLSEMPAGVLVLAIEPVKPALSLAERVRRMLSDRSAAAAAFAMDGTELLVGEAARARPPDRDGWNQIGIAPLVHEAASSGRATGPTAIGAAAVDRLGAGEATVLLATFADAPPATAELEPTQVGSDLNERTSLQHRERSSNRAEPAHLMPLPTAENVVPLRAGVQTDRRATLTPVERHAFHEIARALGARIETDISPPQADDDVATAIAHRNPAQLLTMGIPALVAKSPELSPQPATAERAAAVDPSDAAVAAKEPQSTPSPQLAEAALERAILDRLPVAVLVFRGDELLFANRALFEWTGFPNLAALAAAGGTEALFYERVASGRAELGCAARPLRLRCANNHAPAVEARLFTLSSGGARSMLLMLTRADATARTTVAQPEVASETSTDDGAAEAEEFTPGKQSEGGLDLTCSRVDLNEVLQQCVALLQPQAHRKRIVIRTALSASLPSVLIDARALHQIVLHLLSHSISATAAGGQVIVSTSLNDRGDSIMRVRDTGERKVQTALAPPLLLASDESAGLAFIKALARANGAVFRLKTAPNSGTLVEIVFPAARMLAGEPHDDGNPSASRNRRYVALETTTCRHRPPTPGWRCCARK